MIAEKKAVALTTARKNKSRRESYHNHNTLSTANTSISQKISEHLQRTPKIYQGIYKKAVEGRSLRAAINAFCLECVCWQRKEITLCKAVICPLWKVKPYQEILQDGRNEADSAVESTNSGQGDIG